MCQFAKIRETGGQIRTRAHVVHKEHMVRLCALFAWATRHLQSILNTVLSLDTGLS